MNSYFSQYGNVEESIVMRDRATGKGRGFGFVKMKFNDEDEALKVKEQILDINATDGHYILEKKVDVKSADDF